MKRLFSIFSLSLMLLVGLSIPHAAQAAVTCSPVSSGAFPYGVYTQVCTGIANDPNGSAMAAALNKSYTAASTTFGKYMEGLNKANKYTGVFYLFNSPGDFETWAAATLKPAGVSYPTTIDDTVFAVSVRIATTSNPPIYTAVFVNRGDGFVNKIVGKVTGHEVGHYLDWLLGSIAGKSGVDGGPNIVSNSPYFASELKEDWTLLIADPTCHNTKTGGSGIFTGLADSLGQLPMFSGVYICDDDGNGEVLSSNYSQYTNNQEVLIHAWQYIYNPGSTDGKNTTMPNLELFAEDYSAGTLGYSDSVYYPSEGDRYLGQDQNATDQGFPCIRNFTTYLVANNKLPSKSSPPANWPSACPLQ